MAFIDTQARPAGEVQQKVWKLRLSEAIRIGARIRPQCSGWAFEHGKSCAWGAAWEGSGHPYEEHANYVDILCSSPEWVEANKALGQKFGRGLAQLNDAGM